MSKRKNKWMIELILIIILLALPLLSSQFNITGFIEFSIYPTEEITKSGDIEEIVSGGIGTNGSDFGIQPIENLSVQLKKDEQFEILPAEYKTMATCICANCSNCTTQINAAGCDTIQLTDDINNNAATCINNPNNFSNKIFDCQGHTIDGTDAANTIGIYILGNTKQNNTIQNCILSDFEKAILLYSPDYNQIINNTFNSNAEYGIEIYSNSDYNNITNNTFNFNSFSAIDIDTSDNNTITNNFMNSNGEGYFSGGSDNVLINNIINSSTNFGVYFISASREILINTTITVVKDSVDKATGLFITGITLSQFQHSINQTNTINGLPINYSGGLYTLCPNNTDINLESSYSWFGLVGCNNVTVTAANNMDHVLLAFTTNSTVKGINVTYGDTVGIYLVNSSYSTIVNNTVNYIRISGIQSSYGSNNIITNNTFNYNRRGIWLYNEQNSLITNNTCNSNTFWGISMSTSSNNNIFTTNTAQANARWDFHLLTNSINNTITNLTSYQNLISFTSKDISLKGLQSSEVPANPSNYVNINKWVNATNNSADSYLFINFSYTDADISGIDESSLKIWKYNSTNWNDTGWNSLNVLDITNNIVGVNISNFSSTFAPLGTAIPGPTGGPSHVYPRKEIPEKNITKPEEKNPEIPGEKEIKQEFPTQISETIPKESKSKKYKPIVSVIVFMALVIIYTLSLIKKFYKHKVNKRKNPKKKHATRRMYKQKKKH